jgi:Domain of unknown function (DUF4189)
MKSVSVLSAAAFAALSVGFLVSPPVAHAEQYVGVAVYDPPGPTVDVVYEFDSTSDAAVAHALATCNAKYSSQCQRGGASTTCISVAADADVSWVFDTGPDVASAAANATAKGAAQGWKPAHSITHCSWG